MFHCAGASTATANALWLGMFEFLSHVPTDLAPPNNRLLVTYTDGQSNDGGNPAIPAHILRKKWVSCIQNSIKLLF